MHLQHAGCFIRKYFLLDFVYTLCAIYCHIKRNVNFNGMAMEFHYGGFHLHLLVFPFVYQFNSRIGVLKVAFIQKVLMHLSFPQTDKSHCFPELEF